MGKVNLGRPALARVKVTAAFGSHVADYLKDHGITMRALTGLSFGGDDSAANYQAVGNVLRYAVPDSRHTQEVVAAVAKATGWPAKRRAVDVL